MKNIRLPEKVEMIIEKIENFGGEAYAVGGCVRDSIRGIEPNDWDITTSFTPEKIKSVFEGYKIIDKGIDFGTVAVYVDGEEFEITTFRKDAGSKDCRHPESISFAEKVEDDLSRRDFTVNALAYSYRSGLIDIFNGYGDLKDGRIKAVGNPHDRFKEDALRMLRAIRLSAQHGFKIEEETYEAIKDNAHLVSNISEERFNKELTKILTSDNPGFVEELHKTRLAEYIFPELSQIFSCEQDNPNHYRENNRPTTVGEHTMDVLNSAVKYGLEDEVYNDLSVRLALLVHDFGKPSTKLRRNKKGYGEIDSFFGHPDVSATIAEDCLKRLKFPKSIVNDVVMLARFHDIEFAVVKDDNIVPNGRQLRKAYFEFGGANKGKVEKANEMMNKLIAVRICDASGQNPSKVEGFTMKTSHEKVDEIKLVKSMLSKDILEIVMPVNGEIVREALGMTRKGMKVHGKFIGDVLKTMQKRVIKDNRFLDKLNGDLASETILRYAMSMGLKNIIPDEFFEN